MAQAGRKPQIDKEQLKQLLDQGMKPWEIANRLQVGRPAISKAMKKYCLGKKSSFSGSETSVQNIDEPVEADLNKTLVKMLIDSIKELKTIVAELSVAKLSEKGKLRDTYTKLSQEVRQQIRDLNTLTEKFNEREVIFEFFSGVANAIREEVPPDIRKKVFNRILALRNAYLKMNEVKVEVGEKECPNSES
jgi:predicted transcriptional regulator